MTQSLQNHNPQPAATCAGRVNTQASAEVLRFPAAPEQGSPTKPVLSPADISLALAQDRLVMHYQPQYDLRSGQTIGAEALVRINGLDHKLVYPDRFIELAETGSLSVHFGRAVIKKVIADLADCRSQTLPRMAINLSAHHLDVDRGLARFVSETLRRYGLKHSDLEFELTERQPLTERGRRLLNVLAARGARIVLDDICTGYARVQHLFDLPVSAFKLDRVLVAQVAHETGVQTLIEGLLGIAGQLKLDVLAEGIETRDQAQVLAGYGCQYGQGFGYARPMPIDQLRAFVSRVTPQRQAAV